MRTRRPSPGQTGEAAICERLVAEAASLCGARRVLLVLEAEAGVRVAAFLLPRRERPAELLAAIAPWLDEARRSGKAKLRHGPEGVEARPPAQLHRRPARLGPRAARLPLRRHRRPPGPLRHRRSRPPRRARPARRCRAGERATSAKLALQLEERRAELAVINSIQQAIGAALDFQAIVDVVGDKLREVFATGDLSIRWWDEASQRVQSLYSYEHGVRLPYSTVPSRARHAALPALSGEEAAGRRLGRGAAGHRRGGAAGDRPGEEPPGGADARRRPHARLGAPREPRARQRLRCRPKCGCSRPSPPA